jgi:hypothetical protein
VTVMGSPGRSVSVVVTGTLMEETCVTVTVSPAPGIVTVVCSASPGMVTVVGMVTVISSPSPGSVTVVGIVTVVSSPAPGMVSVVSCPAPGIVSVVVTAGCVTVTGLHVEEGVNVTVEGEHVAVEEPAGTTTELSVEDCAPPLQVPKSFWQLGAAQ